MTDQDRDEDSGLHDIRSLASSAKARLSSRRSTQNPIINEDDLIASSSAGWKAVALPEPAKMVSLPELTHLPTKAELEAAERHAKQAAKADKQSAKADKQAAKAAAVASTSAAAPAVEAPAIASIGSRIVANQSAGKGKLIALVGFGLAAAAGVVFFVATKDKAAPASKVSYESKALSADPVMSSKELPAAAPVAAEPEVADEAATGAADEGTAMAIAAPEAVEEDKPAAKPERSRDKVHKVEIRDQAAKDPKPEKVVVPPPTPETKGSGAEEPSFDALLKEAGVTDPKKVKPKLDKKSLSGSDIKTGMGSVAGKAQACFQGTQGTAAVKLTVAPSGEVQKVTVSGVFKGTPVASCVQAAVKSAKFPAWDGGPQSFGYSYLLAAE